MPTDPPTDLSTADLIELHAQFGHLRTDASRLEGTVALLAQLPVPGVGCAVSDEFRRSLSALEQEAVRIQSMLAALIPKSAVNGRNRQLQRIDDNLIELLQRLEAGREPDLAGGED